MTNSIIINKAKHNHGANINLKSKARDLRKKMTKPEKILWNHIRRKKQHGFYFRRQHPYGIYILDFYCFEINLVIEIDGMIHLSRHEYDTERTKYLESSGLKVIRFNNNDIETRIDWVLKKIDIYLNNPQPQYTEDHFPLGGNKKGGKNI
jgi:5-methyltetrahydrofolate--homocysteine methyltransferase/ATP-dependent helicase HrpA